MIPRKIVRIDEAKCTGCGLCVSPCMEGAIVIVEGKAKVLREELCDGAGSCLGVCPTGALSIEVRDAAPFDRASAETVASKEQAPYAVQHCFRCGAAEDDLTLLPTRASGTSAWVCVRCLPALIHG